MAGEARAAQIILAKWCRLKFEQRPVPRCTSLVIVEWPFRYPIFDSAYLPPLFQVFPEAASVLAAAELSPGVVVSVAEPEVVFAAARGC